MGFRAQVSHAGEPLLRAHNSSRKAPGCREGRPLMWTRDWREGQRGTLKKCFKAESERREKGIGTFKAQKLGHMKTEQSPHAPEHQR